MVIILKNNYLGFAGFGIYQNDSDFVYIGVNKNSKNGFTYLEELQYELLYDVNIDILVDSDGENLYALK